MTFSQNIYDNLVGVVSHIENQQYTNAQSELIGLIDNYYLWGPLVRDEQSWTGEQIDKFGVGPNGVAKVAVAMLSGTQDWALILMLNHLAGQLILS